MPPKDARNASKKPSTAPVHRTISPRLDEHSLLMDMDVAKESPLVPTQLSVLPDVPLVDTWPAAASREHEVNDEPPSNTESPSPPAPSNDTDQNAHTRSPVLAREPTVLENFSKALRDYMPSGIQVPVAVPSPPRVSRPLSFGSFASRAPDTPAMWQYEHMIGSDNGDEQESVRHLMAYPGSSDGDPILWSRWDVLGDGRHILISAHSHGIQVWDCSNLNSVTELLNLRGAEWQGITYAAILLHPLHDPLHSDQPILGIVMNNHDFLLYSLRKQQIIKRISVPGLHSFNSSQEYIIFCTINPRTLHIISNTTFKSIHTINSTSLAPYLDTTQIPVFHLSGRLLAYASAPPRPDSPAGRANAQTASASLLSIPRSSAEIGSTAIKVGGSVLSGMKTLGGLAYSTAMSRIAPVEQRPVVSPTRAGTGMFFSKSAPAGMHERSRSISTATDPLTKDDTLLDTNVNVIKGSYITVIDLQSLASGNFMTSTVACFVAFKHSTISSIQFASDGTSLVAVSEGGQVLRRFHLRPASTQRLISEARLSASAIAETTQPLPWHSYDLRRGHTPGVIECLDQAHDGRWIAAGTKHRTIHVFAINPQGGKADDASHMDGKVRNPRDIAPAHLDVTPIVRLKLAKMAVSPSDVSKPPLVFTFINNHEYSVPSSLLPTHGSHNVSQPKLGSPHSSPMPSFSPPRHLRPTNYQDILVFDPADGELSLRRWFVERRSADQTRLPLPTTAGFGNTSISLPTVSSISGAIGLPIRSTGESGASTKASGLTQMMEMPAELVARSSLVATWGLKRRSDWADVKTPVQLMPAATTATAASKRRGGARANPLAQAELSTHSKSVRVVPKSIYLSHQFSFHTLGEDYHALIRRYHFDLACGAKIDVRKEVAANAYPSTNIDDNESFVGGINFSPQDVRHAPASFDEPLANAMSAGLDYDGSSPVLPMLPNGTSGSYPKSFVNSIPIRSISDGMTGGISRLKREVENQFKMRSPPLRPVRERDGSLSRSVPLEFDEEDDEDFQIASHGSAPVNATRDRDGENDIGLLSPQLLASATGHHHHQLEGGASSSASASISTPSTFARPLEEHEDVLVHDDATSQPQASEDPSMEEWNRWGAEERAIVDDVEMFDDLNPVGFLDEEHEVLREAQAQREKERAAATEKKGKGKGKKRR